MKKIIILTGVSRGCGRALVERWMDEGHTVYGCSRSREAMEELGRRCGAPDRFRVVDVARADEVDGWAEALPPPDLLVNNAAVMNRSAPLWEISEDEFNHLLRVNVSGVANVIRAVLPAMIARGSGVVANISSGWGRSTAPQVAPYCTSKWAIEGLTQALAQELPPGLGAVAVNPGIIDTDMLRGCWGDGAGSFPSPDAWVDRAAPFLLALSATDNGQSLSV